MQVILQIMRLCIHIICMQCKGKSYFDGSDYVLYYKIDTFSGESGAPVFYKSGNKYYALGIHLYGKSEKNGVEWNRGRRITKGIVQAVNKYK